MDARLPTYALYGEQGRTTGTDWLHCESIAERSRLHDWEIRPHRHASLFQILYIRRGRARLLLDGMTHAARGPCVVTVAPLSAHGFSFSPDVDGVVVTVLEQHLHRLLANEKTLHALLLRTRQQTLERADSTDIGVCMAALRREFLATQPWRALAVDAALLNLTVAVARRLTDDDRHAPADAERALGHVRRYRALVERSFRDQPSLSALARELGITTTQLNRVCRRVLGQQALAVMHARLLLEAQRDLAYTTMSVKAIALNLGFADAAYFTRFFTRLSGSTPSAWRSAAVRSMLS